MPSVQPLTFRLKNGSPATVREAEPADARDIIAFVNAVGGESDFLTLGRDEFELTEAEEAEFLCKCQEADNQLYLVATLDGAVVATMHFESGRRVRVRHSGEFGMSVRKAHWGQGIGSALLDTLLVWAAQTAIIKKINLRVRADNERAIRLYEAKGFKHEGTLTNELLIDGRYYDLYAMGLNL